MGKTHVLHGPMHAPPEGDEHFAHQVAIGGLERFQIDVRFALATAQQTSREQIVGQVFDQRCASPANCAIRTTA